jgi:hypothetical protein
MSRSHARRLIFVAMILGMRAFCLAAPEEPNTPALKAPEGRKTRTELLNELELRKAQVTLEHARQAYDRDHRELGNSQALFQRHIISKQELDRAISADAQSLQNLRQAEIALEQTKLGFLANATHITILEAKKYYDNEGRRMLDLVLKNTSNLRQAESSLILADPNLQAGLAWQDPDQIQALLNIENIIVSIVTNNSSIGKPYEEIIPVLPYGEQKKVSFELLTDVEQAGVKLQYLNQQVMDTVYLEKESLQEIPTIVATQFSLEGVLGTEVRYDLSLEMLVTSDRNFTLAVTNVPAQINCYFMDSTGSSRITSVRFTQVASKYNLSLRASIPRNLDVGMIDKRIDFQVWAVTLAQMELINKLKRQRPDATLTNEELTQIGTGRVDLSLIPRGAGSLEILIDNLYTEITLQDEALVQSDLHNDGTLTLFNVTPEISPPPRWEAVVEPNTIERMLPNEKKTIRIRLRPPSDADVGEYETMIEARGQSGSETVEAIEKRVKVRINPESGLSMTLLLVGGLVVLVVGIVIFGVKLSRR